MLLVEGELNAAAAWQVLEARGWDVQGVPGTDTWPFLEGLDREVWVYADGDGGGDAMRARLQDLAYACGARGVHQVPALAGQDFCDLLGAGGEAALVWAIFADAPRPRPDRPRLYPAQIEAYAARQSAPLIAGLAPPNPDWPLARTPPT
ncbi:toprim domain-containing protein [Deinococcus frigens]|uniref:toprim domain-containing protein n=1 Tax=Deinococcus frigens TaxID=249403 RepID=UPI00068E2CBF|nr:toprim domain-containing protein [Deinococcus frigens]